MHHETEASDRVKKSARYFSTWNRHLLEKIESEIQFAEFLCGRNPGKSAKWRPLVNKAAEIIDMAINSSSSANLSAAVKDSEKILSPLSSMAKTYTINCIGHAHIDMNWMWSWPETVAVTNDTFTTVLKLLDEFPEFCFSQSQASIYAIVEKYNPEMLEKIQAKVREGRWEVTASHWVENDNNIVGGEALCRHILYTRKYMRKLFGIEPEDVQINWAPDTFGHAATIPSYLARGGVKYMYLHRPGAEGPARPRAFYWEGPDSSRILVKNDMEMAYNCTIGPHIATKYLCDFAKETGLRFVSVVYGVGDHGGGPTKRDILRGIDMNSWPIFPEIKFSSAKEFFQRLGKEGANLPVIDNELNFELTGCYTTQALIKKASRFSEKKLIDAEKASVLAGIAFGSKYESSLLEEGWRDSLFSHFHDILPGSGVHDTRTYCHGIYQNIVAMTGMEETKALRLLSSKVNTAKHGFGEKTDYPCSLAPLALGSGVGYGSVDGGISGAEQSVGYGNRPFLVFNPSEHERNEVIEVSVWDNSSWENIRKELLRNIQFSVKAPDGKIFPCQTLETGSYWGHDFIKLAFPVKVPGIGYSVYTVIEENSCHTAPPIVSQIGKKHHCSYLFNERGPEGLENDFVRFELDMEMGGIKSLLCKKTGKSLVNNLEIPILEYAEERAHSMSAWCIEHTGAVEKPKVVSVSQNQKGPYKASIDVNFKIHESDISLRYELRAGDPTLYIAINAIWFQRGTPQTGIPVLNLAIPLNLQNPVEKYEIPFGEIERRTRNGQEVPALRWAKVTGEIDGKKHGCLLLNDSKHGYSFKNGVLRLSLIRSAYDPDILPDIGKHEINTGIRLFSGNMTACESIRNGANFNNGLKIVGTDIHKGELPDRLGMIDIDCGSAIVSGIKKAEDSDAIIIRLFNPEKEKSKVCIGFNSQMLGEVKNVSEVDLMERPIVNKTMKFTKDSIHFTIPGNGITTIKACIEI